MPRTANHLPTGNISVACVLCNLNITSESNVTLSSKLRTHLNQVHSDYLLNRTMDPIENTANSGNLDPLLLEYNLLHCKNCSKICLRRQSGVHCPTCRERIRSSPRERIPHATPNPSPVVVIPSTTPDEKSRIEPEPLADATRALEQKAPTPEDERKCMEEIPARRKRGRPRKFPGPEKPIHHCDDPPVFHEQTNPKLMCEAVFEGGVRLPLVFVPELYTLANQWLYYCRKSALDGEHLSVWTVWPGTAVVSGNLSPRTTSSGLSTTQAQRNLSHPPALDLSPQLQQAFREARPIMDHGAVGFVSVTATTYFPQLFIALQNPLWSSFAGGTFLVVGYVHGAERIPSIQSLEIEALKQQERMGTSHSSDCCTIRLLSVENVHEVDTNFLDITMT